MLFASNSTASFIVLTKNLFLAQGIINLADWWPDFFGRRTARSIQALISDAALSRVTIECLQKQVARNEDEIAKIQATLASAVGQETREKKEVRCRQIINSVVSRYFLLGLRDADVAIPFDQVKIDSNPDWIPEILSRSDLTEPEFAIFKFFRDDRQTILDIGANYGYGAASIWAAGATSNVLSFEPNFWHGPCLARIKALRAGRFDYTLTGLGAKVAETKFVIPVIEGIGISALGSAVIEAGIDWAIPENVLAHMMSDHPNLKAPKLQFTEVMWRTERLDDVLLKATFDVDVSAIAAIKIDVEGFEPEVLAGSAKTLALHKPLIMVEGANRNPDVVETLLRQGYQYADFIDGDANVVLTEKKSNRANGFFLHRQNIPAYRSSGLLQGPSY